MVQPIVLGFRPDGLGARVVNIATGLYLARRLGRQFRYWWIHNGDVANATTWRYVFDDAKDPRLAMSEYIWDFFTGRPPMNSFIISQGMTLNEDSFTPESNIVFTWHYWLRFGSDTYAEMRAGLRQAAALMPPSRNVQAAIDAAPVETDLSRAIGVHVRRGDLIGGGPANETRIIATEDYFRFLDAYFPDEDIFLCTEDVAIIEEFRQRYGRRVHAGVSKGFNRGSVADLQQAYADMVLMSRCRAILGGLSAFNRAAAALGGQPLFNIVRSAHPSQTPAARAVAELEALGDSDLLGRFAPDHT